MEIVKRYPQLMLLMQQLLMVPMVYASSYKHLIWLSKTLYLVYLFKVENLRYLDGDELLIVCVD